MKIDFTKVFGVLKARSEFVDLTVLDRAHELYMQQNFPDGNEGYPPGFPEEMWHTARPEVVDSWITAARAALKGE